ncbi:MAG: phage regulatory protein/antirepressor Ant [Bacteroidota bacterium]
MKDLQIKNGKVSSLSLSEFTEKPHNDLLKAIRSMESSWVMLGQGNFSQSSYLNSQNKNMPMYELTKTEFLYIASKFSDDLRAKIIIRWEQLENQNPIVNLSRADILRMALEAEEKVQLQENELRIQAPKVKYHDQVLSSKSTYTTNQIAKELGTSAITLNRMLNSKKIQYKQNDTWLLYSKYQDKGYTKTKTYTYTGTTGEQKTSMQTVWTELGRSFIHDVFNSSLEVA